MADRFDVGAFGRDAEAVARLVRAEDVFSFLNRQVSVPASCVALVWGEAKQPSVVPAGRSIDAAGIHELLFVRSTPFFIDYQFDGLSSKDGHACSASVRLSVQVVPDRAELTAFRQSLVGSSGRVDAADLRRHCEEAARSALIAFAKARDAAELVSAENWGAFDDVLVERFRPVGFESGLALGPDPRVEITSQAYVESRRADAAAEARNRRLEEERQRREASAKAREEHVKELGTLLDRVKQMAADQPGVAVADLIKTFGPAQRGIVYEGLAAVDQATRRTEAILVVAGDELLRFAPANLERPTHRRDLSSEIGSLRSVRVGRVDDKDVVLVGARRGVHVIEADDDPPRTFAFATEAELRGGVNAAATVGGHVYATHSEVGLVRWKLSEPGPHEKCLADITEAARAVRDVQADDIGRLWLAVDNIVVGWRPSEETPSLLLSAPAVVTVALVVDGSVYAGMDDGGIVAWDIADPARMKTIRDATGNAVRSIDWLSGGGVPRLLIADKRPHLELKVLDDVYVGEYRCGQKMRWGFGAEDWIVGVNDRRDQLFTWRPDQPQLPTAGVSVGRLVGRSIQDVALMPYRA